MKYKYNGNTFLVYEGELYVRVESELTDLTDDKAVMTVASRIPRKAPKKIKKVQRQFKGKRKRGVDPELKAQIAREYKQGATIAELVRKYKQLSYGTVYLACKSGAPKVKGNSGEPLKLSALPQKYVCSNGHHFESKFPLSHARCPECHTLAAELDSDEPVIEELDGESIA